MGGRDIHSTCLPPPAGTRSCAAVSRQLRQPSCKAERARAWTEIEDCGGEDEGQTTPGSWGLRRLLGDFTEDGLFIAVRRPKSIRWEALGNPSDAGVGGQRLV